MNTDTLEKTRHEEGFMRRDPERHAEQIKAANRARWRATRQLQAENPDRWRELYERECAKEGVTPRWPSPPEDGDNDGDAA